MSRFPERFLQKSCTRNLQQSCQEVKPLSQQRGRVVCRWDMLTFLTLAKARKPSVLMSVLI